MSCKKCFEIKNQCFFHETKSIILTKSENDVKKWIDKLYLYNSNELLYTLVTSTYPKLLKQTGIYKKSNIFITNITDYILEITNKRFIKIKSKYREKLNLKIFIKIF